MKKDTDTLELKDILPEKENCNYKELLTNKPKGKYTKKYTLGQGGMKQIISVNDRDTARDIAMAVMLCNEKKEDDKVLRFINEARIASNLEHPNICPVYDIGIDENENPYFTMKLIKGENLEQVLDRTRKGDNEYVKKYTQQYLLEIFKKVCNAISFAHSKGIIHLDLKPENIQVGEFGEVLVLDWGLAKLISENEIKFEHYIPKSTIHKNLHKSSVALTEDGIIKGTPGYMAPEQAMGLNSRKDFKTDIYGLGGILYSILTFSVPVEGDSSSSILSATIKGYISSPKLRVPQIKISTALEAITMKALATEPKNRYEKVEILINDLDNYTAGFATAAENANIFKQLYLLIKRHKLFFATFAISIFAIITLSIIFMFRLNQKEQIALKEKGYAENLAEDMLFNLYDKLEKVGRLNLLENIANKVTEYYKNRGSLSKEQVFKFCDAYDKLGNVYKSQGKSKKALIVYEKALKIRMNNYAKKIEIANSHRNIGTVLFNLGKSNAAYNSLETAIKLLETMENSNVNIEAELAKSYNQFCFIIYNMKDKTELATIAKKGYDISKKHFRKFEWKKDLANFAIYLIIAKETDKECFTHVNDAIMNYENMVELEPNNIKLKIELAHLLREMSYAYSIILKNKKTALKLKKQEVTIRKTVYEFDKNNKYWAERLCEAYIRFGDLSDEKEKYNLYFKATEISNKLSEIDKNNITWQLYKYWSYDSLANLEKNKQLKKVYYNKAINASSKLGERFQFYKDDIMWTKYYLIKLQINNNELKEAKRGFEQLIKDYPDNKKLKSKYKEIFK